MKNNILSVFTKPWQKLTSEQLAEHVLKLGFNAIEFPLRDGYQVEPKNAVRDFPKFTALMKDYGITVTSIGGDIQESMFEACGAAGVKLIRIMSYIDTKIGYMKSEAEWVKKLYDVLPFCEKYGVKVGIQQHSGPCVYSSMDVRHLCEQVGDSRYVGAIWDAGHSTVANEIPEFAFDILWDYLFLVNFKASFIKQVSESKWQPVFTTAQKSASDWKRCINYLFTRGYDDVICLPAEYSDTANVDTYIAEDIAYMKSIIADWGK